MFEGVFCFMAEDKTWIIMRFETKCEYYKIDQNSLDQFLNVYCRFLVVENSATPVKPRVLLWQYCQNEACL